MKALILSAGQGRRLLPLTADAPKCTLLVQGRPLIDWQLSALAQAGIDEVVAVVGFRRERVAAIVAARPEPPRVRLLDNPLYGLADNLVSCWMAREEMDEDFLLLNGDTLFETDVVRRLLAAPARPVTLVVDAKPVYDADDMKVTLDGERVVAIGKHLGFEATHAESIGMLLFRGQGPALFRAGLERAVQVPEGARQWYLSVIDSLAASGVVWSASIRERDWVEVDCPADLDDAERLVASWDASAVGPRARRPAPGRRHAPACMPFDSSHTHRQSSTESTSTAARGNGSTTTSTPSPSRREILPTPSPSESRRRA
jgi:L-glutamine-phosphate cytidylyltransferase